MDRHPSTESAPAAAMMSSTGPRQSVEAPRYLLYSHDSWGLGHLRRNLTLAQALTASRPGASVLLVTGSPCATFFDAPERVELIKLPSVTKDDDGAYRSRNLPGGLQPTLELRRRLLLETYRAFRPHAILVDHQVVGLKGEALPLLQSARADGVRTVLGVRDIIDSPDVVAREWGGADARWALKEGYDRVCVYGSPEVFDTVQEYPIPPELGQNLEYVGYVVRDFPRHSRRPVPALRPQVLVTVGGGEDGAVRLECVIEALEVRPSSFDTVIVGGPLLDARDARRLKRRVRERKDIHLHRFHSNLPRLLAESNLVVCMAGYNTCAEVLHSGRRAVFLPRTSPRREQAIRAERLGQLGYGTSLEVPTAACLAEAIVDELDREYSEGGVRRWMPPMNGAGILTQIMEDLIDGVPASSTSRLDQPSPRARDPFRLAASLGALRCDQMFAEAASPAGSALGGSADSYTSSAELSRGTSSESRAPVLRELRG